MAEKYVGSYVSIECKENAGYYQGQVVNVDTANQTLTLQDVWKNGLKSPSKEITLLAKEIVDLKIIPSPKEEKSKSTDYNQKSAEPLKNKSRTNARDSPRKFDSQPAVPTQPFSAPETPSKLKKGKPKLGKDDVCFGTEFNTEKDFDFETNLALFDKKAVMGEIKLGKQQEPPLGLGAKTVAKFRPDENVLESQPPTYRQIILPDPSEKEFLTDAGLVVPCTSAEMKGKLQAAMEKAGIGIERRSESIARAVADVALHFLGGPHRLTPKNSHQKPVVVILCGNHPEAAGAVCAGRHLATLGVRTIVYLQTPTVPSFMIKEIELYKLTGQYVINNPKNLPASSDLILACLIPPSWNGGDFPKMDVIIEWANKQRAPTMSIDQPPSQLITAPVWLDIKCTLTADIPLAYGHKDGKLYLYSLATPRNVFQSLGVEYASPFGSKFVITLHESS